MIETAVYFAVWCAGVLAWGAVFVTVVTSGWPKDGGE